MGWADGMCLQLPSCPALPIPSAKPHVAPLLLRVRLCLALTAMPLVSSQAPQAAQRRRRLPRLLADVPAALLRGPPCGQHVAHEAVGARGRQLG